MRALAALLVALMTAANAMPPAPVAEAGAAVQGAFILEGALVQGGIVRGTAPAGTIGLTLDGKPVALAAGGRFLLGFDRDQAETATLVAQLAGGGIVREPLAIAPRAWRIEHVNVARRPSNATEDYLKRRAAELERIAAARAIVSTSDGWRQRFIWPATGRISGLFGSQRVYRSEPGAYHSGVDVAPGAGAPVVAPADGIVVLAGPPLFSLEGNLVILDHGMGLNSAFLHLGSVAVHEGQAVRQGEPIGTVGASGRVTGPHLHWSMKWNDARLDPQDLAGAMGN